MGLRDDSRQSRVPRKPSDWRGASESSAGQTGLNSLVAGGESGGILSYREAAGVNCEMALRSVSGVK